MKKVINKIISSIKKESYELDNSISNIDLIKILLLRFIMLLRGTTKKIWFKKSPKKLFLGKNSKILFKNKIKCNGIITIGNNCRIDALSKDGISIGNNFKLGDNSIIECTGVIRNLGEGLIIGDNVGISPYAYIGARGKITIGNDTIIGPYLNMHSENHIFADPNKLIRISGESRKGISIGSNCWIGSNVSILDGVTVGDNCVIGAGAVITKSIPDNSIVVGNPGRKIKERV